MTIKINITSYTKDGFQIEILETGSLKKAFLQNILIKGRQEDKDPQGETIVTLHHGNTSMGDFEEHADITHCFNNRWRS